MALGYREDVFNAVETATLEQSERAHQQRMEYDSWDDDKRALYNTLENSRALLSGQADATDEEMQMAALKIARGIAPDFMAVDDINIFRPKAQGDFASGAEALQYMVDFVDGKANGITQEGNAYLDAFKTAKEKGGDTFDENAFNYDYAKKMGYEDKPFDMAMLSKLKGDPEFDAVYEVLEDGRLAYKKGWDERQYYADMLPFQEKAVRADTVDRFHEDQKQHQAFALAWMALGSQLSQGANEIVARAVASGTDALAYNSGRTITLEENAAYQLDRSEGESAMETAERMVKMGSQTYMPYSHVYAAKDSGLQDTMTKQWSTPQLLEWLAAQPQNEVQIVQQLVNAARGKVGAEQWWQDAGTRLTERAKDMLTAYPNMMQRIYMPAVMNERVKRFNALRDLNVDVDNETRRQYLNGLALSRLSSDLQYENYGWFKDDLLNAVEQLPIWGLLAAGAPFGAMGTAATSGALTTWYWVDSYDTMIERGVDHNVAVVTAAASAVTQMLLDHVEFGVLKGSTKSMAMADFLKSLVGHISDGVLKRSGKEIALASLDLASELMRDTLIECVQEGLQKASDEFAIGLGHYFTNGTFDGTNSSSEDLFLNSFKAGVQEAKDTFGTMLISVGGGKGVGVASTLYNAARLRSPIRAYLDSVRAVEGLEANGKRWNDADIAKARAVWSQQRNNKARINALKQMGLTQTAAEALHTQFRAQDIIAERHKALAASRLIDTTLAASREFLATEEGKLQLNQMLKIVFGGEVDVQDVEWTDGDKVHNGIGIKIGERIIPIAIDENHSLTQKSINIPTREAANSVYNAVMGFKEFRGMDFETFADEWKDEGFRTRVIKQYDVAPRGNFNPMDAKVAIQVTDENGNTRTEYVPAIGVILLNWDGASAQRASYSTVIHETLHAVARIVRDSGLLSEEERAKLQETFGKQVASEEFGEENAAELLEAELGYLLSEVLRDNGNQTKYEGLRGWFERILQTLGNVILGSDLAFSVTNDGELVFREGNAKVNMRGSNAAHKLAQLVREAGTAMNEAEDVREEIADAARGAIDGESRLSAGVPRLSESEYTWDSITHHGNRVMNIPTVTSPTFKSDVTLKEMIKVGIESVRRAGGVDVNGRLTLNIPAFGNVAVGREGIKHGLRPYFQYKDVYTKENADTLSILGDILLEAIPVNEMAPRKEDLNKNVNGSTILLSCARTIDGNVHPVIVVVNHFLYTKDGYPDIKIYPLKSVNVKNLGAPGHGLHPSQTAHLNSSTIKIADLIESVKDILPIFSKDVYNHFNQSRPTEGEFTDGLRYSARAQAQREYDDVVARYKGTDQWMKAPNGKPTNLTERQWVQVRTPSFKKWFGDWEKDAEVYTIVDVQSAPFSNVSAAIEWVKGNGVIGVMTNEETGGKGEINISVGSIREMLNPRQREKSVSAAAHFAALTKLREIIRESKVVESHPDYKKGADGKRSKENGINPDVEIDVLYGAIHFGDDVYRVKTRIKRYSQPSETSKAYSYQVSEIEVLPGTLEEAKSHTLPTDKTSITGNKLLQGVLNVNGNLILDHSKVVDENGEPLVVYHGTESGGFTEFIDTDDIGYFFTSSFDMARSYSGERGVYAPSRIISWDEALKEAETFGTAMIEGYAVENVNGRMVADSFYPSKEEVEANLTLNKGDKVVKAYRIDDGYDEGDVFLEKDLNEFVDTYARPQDAGLNYEVFLNLKDPLIVNGNGSNWDNVIDHVGTMVTYDELTDEQKERIAEEMGVDVDELEDYQVEDLPVFDIDNFDVRTPQRTRDWVSEAADMGCDGVIFKDIYDEGKFGYGTLSADVFVAMRANQIKSTENVAPTENDDIRYSIVSARRPDLVGLHNMSAEGLKGADDLGGFAMPSIAITRDSMGHNEFGDISLLMRTSAFNPQVNRLNKIYSRDAWTPTFPGIINKVDAARMVRVSERLLDTLPADLRKAYTHGDTYSLLYEDGVNDAFKTVNTAGEYYRHNAALKAAYLVAKGETLQPVMKQKSFLGRSSGRILALGEEGLRLINDSIGDLLVAFHSVPAAELDAWIEQHRGEIEAAFIDAAYASRVAKNPAVAEYSKEEIYGDLFKKNPLGFSDVIDLADAVAKLRKAIAKGEADVQTVDEYATKRAINERVSSDDADFIAWLDEQYGNPVLARGIRNTKEFYTPSGNRRSWDALHDPVTLSNVVKNMLSKQREQGEGFLGANPFGLAAAKLNSFKDVIKHEDLLKELPKEEMDAIRDEFIAAFNEISARYLNTWKYTDDNPFTASARSDEALLDAWAASKGSFAGLKRELNGYGRTASDDLIRDLQEVMNGIAKFPTKYFEAKPMRAVGFEEVAAAIIPDNTTEETREILKRRGVPVYEYTAGNDTSRLAALNMAADDVKGTRFSVVLGERGAANLNANLNAMDNLSVAKQMLGDDDWTTISKEQKQKIKRATGWEKGADGKWRYEWLDFKVRDIEDDRRTIVSKMTSAERRKFNDYMWNIDTLSDKRRANFKAMREKYGYKLNDELTLADILYGNGANGLFNAYPQLRDMRVRFKRIVGDVYGWYNDETNEIVLKEDYLWSWMNDALRKTLTHEVQHVIQHIEGLALGGHPIMGHANELADQYNTLVERANAGEEIPQTEIDASYKRYVEARNKAYDDYHRLAGEVESRNAESRRYLNFKDYPTPLLLEDTEDVARDQQIVKEIESAVAKLVSYEQHAAAQARLSVAYDADDAGAEGGLDPARLAKAEQKAKDAAKRFSLGSLYHGRSPFVEDLLTSDFVERVVADRAKSTGRKPSKMKLQNFYRDFGVAAPEGKRLAEAMERIQRIVDDDSKHPLEDYATGIEAMTDEELRAYSRGVSDASQQWTHGVAREVQQVARERKAEVEAVTGITPEVIAAENGFDPLATIVLANDRHLTEEERKILEQKRKEARAKREAEVRQELEGNAPDFDEDMLSHEYLESLEARKRKLREATKQFEAERREALKRLASRSQQQEDENGNPIEGAVDEDQNELDDLRAKVFEGIAYDLDAPMGIEEFVAMLQYLSVEHSLGHAPTSAEMREAMKDPIAVRDFARTASQMADRLAEKLCYGYGRERAKQAAERMATAETAYQARRLAMSAFMTISNCRIRETKRAYFARMKKALKEGIERGRFATNREDLDRKVTADLEWELREIRKVIQMGSNRLQEYRENALKKRMAFTADQLKVGGTWRDLMAADVMIAIADEFGGWRDKTLGEIEDMTRKIEQMVETGVNDMDARREAYVKKVQSLVEPLTTALLHNTKEFGAESVKGKEKAAQWIENKVVAMQKLLMQSLVFGKLPAQVRMEAERVAAFFVRSYDHAAAVKNTKVVEYQKRLDEINTACYGSTKACTEAHNQEVPEWLNRLLTNRRNADVERKNAEAKAKGETVNETITQSTRFTRGQAIQLYASITQADYAENARLWERDGKALKALREYLTDTDIKWVAQMSGFFAETFPELQDCFKRITGRTIGTTPNYWPVKMRVPREGISGKVRMYSNFYASMEPRRRNALDFDESVSALDMVIGRMDEFAHMLAYGELGILTSDVFGNARLLKAIEKAKGKEYLHRLHANLLDTLMGAESSDSESAVALRRVAQWTSVLAMSGNIGSAIKQFGGIPSFANEIGFKGLADAYAEFFAKDGWEWDYITSTPEYKARYQVGNNPDMMATITGQPMSRLAKVYRGGMKLQMIADEAVAKAVVVGLFRMKLRKYLAEGMDEAKAREYAATDAWGVVERTQQSGYEHNRHHLIRSSAWVRLMATFRTTPIQQLQFEAKALADYLRGEEGAGKKLLATIFINHVLGPLALTLVDAAFNAALGGFARDDDDKRRRLLKRLTYQLASEMVFGPTVAIPILGGVLECIFDFATQGKDSALSPYNLDKKAMDIPAVSTAWQGLNISAQLLDNLFTLDYNEMIQDAEDIVHKNVAPYRQFKTAMENWTDNDWDEFLEEEFPKK